MKESPASVNATQGFRSVSYTHLWALSITDYATGDHSEKPAYYMDGNHHAGEVTGSMACIYFAYRLVTGYGQDDKITALLKTTTYYICLLYTSYNPALLCLYVLSLG